MRARDFLTKKASTYTRRSLIPQISAEAFHTRLVDSASSRIRVEVFQVKFEKGDGKTHSLLGLRDFTDLAAISAPNLPDAPDSPRDSPRGSFLLGTGDEQLEEEMMTKVRSNMTSIRSLASRYPWLRMMAATSFYQVITSLHDFQMRSQSQVLASKITKWDCCSSTCMLDVYEYQ